MRAVGDLPIYESSQRLTYIWEQSVTYLYENSQWLTYVFKRFAEFCELIQTLLYDIRRPLIDFIVLVSVASYGSLNCLHKFLKKLLTMRKNYKPNCD